MYHLATWDDRKRPPRSRRRAGFTLIELLVVILIILLLSGFTLAIWNTTVNSDRIRSGSRTLQSYLLGARDRAAHDQAFRGLRLIPDPNNNNLVRACQYISPMTREVYPLHSIRLERPDPDNDPIATPADASLLPGTGTSPLAEFPLSTDTLQTEDPGPSSLSSSSRPASAPLLPRNALALKTTPA